MAPDWLSRAHSLDLCVQNFVNGRRCDAQGPPLAKFSPRDGALLSRMRSSRAQEVDDAVACSRRAFEDGRWSRQSVQHRKDVLFKLASLIDQYREELALLECVDVGKPISEALGSDLPLAASELRSYAEAVDKIYGRVYASDQTSLSYQLRRPIGVVAGIIGWNFPLLLAVSKLGPALATGNCLVLKPSELTAFSAGRLAELAIEAGVPEGVFNVVHGSAAVGIALAQHQDVDLITFTGSSETGKRLLIASGCSNMKRLLLECGGKAPTIVFDDGPSLDFVARAIVAHAFRNQGQVCTAGSRLLVHNEIKEELLLKVIAATATLNPGDPLRSETKFGAVVSRDHQLKVQDYVDSGIREGARLVYRSEAPAPYANGFYVSPVIFDNVSPSLKISQEEIFGPVLSVTSFRDEHEAITIANGTRYGLSATVWTSDLSRAQRMSQGLKAGWVVVNASATPMGGPAAGVLPVGGLKESGMGVEGGLEGLEAYTSSTTVQIFA